MQSASIRIFYFTETPIYAKKLVSLIQATVGLTMVPEQKIFQAVLAGSVLHRQHSFAQVTIILVLWTRSMLVTGFTWSVKVRMSCCVSNLQTWHFRSYPAVTTTLSSYRRVKIFNRLNIMIHQGRRTGLLYLYAGRIMGRRLIRCRGDES